MKETKTGLVPARPPSDVVDDMLADVKPLPVLKGIVGTPVFSADGVIVTTTGYQRETRLYYVPEGAAVPPISQCPTSEELARATWLIKEEWLADFPFVDDASKANTVGAAITPLVRDLFQGCSPLYVSDAPTPGTESLLMESVAEIVCGSGAGVMNDTRIEDELRKRITSLLKEGTSVAVIDNVRREVDSGTLAALLTSTVWVDRQLGDNHVLRLPNRALWVVSGNNVRLSNEIARRSVWIRLDSRVDRPWEREGFRHPQSRLWIAQHRHELLWALLTLGQNWIAQDCPAWPGKPLGSFESWSLVVGGILEAARVEGFLANREELYKRVDTETEEWRAFVQAWWDDHGGSAVGTADLVPLVQQKGHLPSIVATMKDGAGDRSYSMRLGKALAEHRDRKYGDYFLRDLGIDGHSKVTSYRLEPAHAGPVRVTTEAGTAEVPRDFDPSTDSDAVLAVDAVLETQPAHNTLFATTGQEITTHERATKEVPQVPQTDSKKVPSEAVPAVEEGDEVPQAGTAKPWEEDLE